MPFRGALGGEIHQNRPFHSSRQEAVLGLFRTSDLLKRHFTRILEPCGVTFQQYNVLRILRGAGEDGLATLTIADRMIERTPGITRLLDRLEAKRLAARERSTTDRRRVFCRITAAGLELLAELDGPMDEADDSSLSMVSEEELDRLIDVLDRVRRESEK